MRHLFDIGHNDLRLFLRNRSALVWLFLMPLVFVYFMGAANRGPGSPENPRPLVLVENVDTGFLGMEFLKELGAQGLNVVSPTNAAGAQRGIRIPADFTDAILGRRQARVKYFTVEGSSDAAAAMIEFRVARAVIALDSHLLELATAVPGSPVSPAGLEGVRNRPDPVRLEARFAGRKPIPTGYRLSLPGVLVMYLLMNLLTFGGSALAWERRSGVLKRMTLYPVARHAIVAGKVYGLMLLAVIQIAFLLLAGRFLFGVNLGDQLGGVLLVLVVYAWVAASLGVLVGAVVRAEDKVSGLCVLASIVMAALGGCWWPLEVVPAWARTIAFCLPTGWGMEALHQMITFGSGFTGASAAIGVLLLFGAAANLAAARFFRV